MEPRLPVLGYCLLSSLGPWPGASPSRPGPCSLWGSPAGCGDAHCSQSEGWGPVSGDRGATPYTQLGWQTGCAEGLEPRGGRRGGTKNIWNL